MFSKLNGPSPLGSGGYSYTSFSIGRFHAQWNSFGEDVQCQKTFGLRTVLVDIFHFELRNENITSNCFAGQRPQQRSSTPAPPKRKSVSPTDPRPPWSTRGTCGPKPPPPSRQAAAAPLADSHATTPAEPPWADTTAAGPEHHLAAPSTTRSGH